MNRLRLPHDETDERKRYTMPDPDELSEIYSDAYHARYGQNFTSKPLTDEQATAVLAMAGAFIHLTMYELGQEHCVAQLRDIWRARRAKATTPSPASLSPPEDDQD